MFKLIENPSPENLSKVAGAEYSLSKRLRIIGTGSSKLIHIEGLDFLENFTAASQTNHLVSFEVRPESLIGRVNGKQDKTFLIKKDEVVQIQFETFNLKIRTKIKTVIRHEAIIEFILKDGRVKFYSPRSKYKSINNFFVKEWLAEKTKFSFSTKEPEVNSNALILEIISKLLA